MPETKTPTYDPVLRAFHQAFSVELRRIIEELPLAPDARLLDLCCGDGFYSRMLAKRLNEAGELTALDHSDEYLRRARARLEGEGHAARMRFVSSSAYSLPFKDASFDLVWCAQSFISLEDPVGVLREIRRALRPKGFVAILESDEFHHLFLRWLLDLEIAVQRALQASFKERYGSGSKAAPARKLATMLREAGFNVKRKKTYVADRQAPFAGAMRRFLKLHLRDLGKMIRPHLSKQAWTWFRDFAAERGPGSLFDRSDADLSCLNVLFLGRSSPPVG